VEYEVLFRLSVASLKVALELGEEITAAPGSWVYARGPWKVKTHSIRGALRRSFSALGYSSTTRSTRMAASWSLALRRSSWAT